MAAAVVVSLAVTTYPRLDMSIITLVLQDIAWASFDRLQRYGLEKNSSKPLTVAV